MFLRNLSAVMFRKTKISLFLAFFPNLLFSQEQGGELTLKKSDCLRLIQEDLSSDATYKPGVDVKGRPVAPADLEGSLKVQVPEVIRIPIRFDLKKYFRVPQEVTRKNHQELEKILQERSATDDVLRTEIGDISDRNLDALNRLTQITTEAEKPLPDTQKIDTLFDESLTKLKDGLTILSEQPSRLSSDQKKLTQSLSILKKQFNPYEEDPLILEKNHTLRDATSQSTLSAQSNITVSAAALDRTRAVYQDTKTLFEKTLHERGSQADALKSKFQEVGTLLQHVRQAFSNHQIETSEVDRTSSLQKNLANLTSQLENLNMKAQSYLDDAEIGEVTFSLKDNRLYFNGQPLFDEDRAKIKDMCRKLLKP